MYIKLDGQKLLLENILNSSTIDDMKREIFSQRGLPMDEQRLIFSGKQLQEGNRLLSEFNISCKDTILVLSQENPNKEIDLVVATVRESIQLKFRLSLSETISNLRRRIKERLPPKLFKGDDDFLLFHNGIQLGNHNFTLKDYNIVTGSTIYIATSVRIVLDIETETGQHFELAVDDPDLCGELVEEITKTKATKKKSCKRKQKCPRERTSF